MSTPYQRLTRLRERAVEVRDSLPIGSVEGEFYADYIDLIDEAMLEVVRPEPEPEEKDEDTKDDDTKELTWGQWFAIDNFLHDLRLPPCQMGIWS